MQDFPSRVRELVVVASSSRSGSSMLAEILRKSSALVHLRAEINPFLRLVGLGFPTSGTGSDRLSADDLNSLRLQLRQVLAEELALDAGCPCDQIDDERFVLDVAWRLAIQWPELDLDLGLVTAAARQVLDRLRRAHQWATNELRDIPLFQLELLSELRAAGLPVEPCHYDLPRALLDSTDRRPSHGAPGNALVEEPPFVLPRLWRRVDEQDLVTKALVIKTPSNAYRLDFLCALFPYARIRVLHLTRIGE